MLTRFFDWMHTVDEWKILLVAAAIGAGAALLRSLKRGLTWRLALLESAIAFILCELTGSLLMQYTELSVGVIFGICGVIGMNSEKVSDRVTRLIDASGDRVEKEVRGEVPHVAESDEPGIHGHEAEKQNDDQAETDNNIDESSKEFYK
jgi:hypothetical protein